MTQGTEAITTVYFVLMALLALLVVIAIGVGMRKKRLRAEAEREVAAHIEEAGVEPAVPSDPKAPESPLPVMPAPPSLADDPVAGIPLARDIQPAHPLDNEPIAAVIAPDGTAATIAADAEAPAADPLPADGPVTQLKGLGPKVATRLAELGIDRIGQIAALDEPQAAALDAELGSFAGRLSRDRWVEQARLLVAGDGEGFERAFGKL